MEDELIISGDTENTGATETNETVPVITGLRDIIIPMADEFGLQKCIKIRSLHIYLDKNSGQKIEVSYFIIWSFEGTEVKREISHFTLDNSNPDKLYLDIWDNLVGETIAGGIISWFS